MSLRRKLLIGLGCLLLGASLALVWVLRSGTINRYVVERAQAEIEKAIGAKLEVGTLHIDVWQGRAVAEGVILHGKERAGEVPLFTAREVSLDARLSSFSQGKVDLRGLALKDPQIRIITYPDGTTNLPGPLMKKGTPTNGLENFVDLRLGRLEVEKGEFSWDERRAQFSLSAKDFVARMDYLAASRGYRGKVEAENLRYEQGETGVIEGRSKIEFAMNREKISIEKASLQTAKGTELTAKGEIRNLDGKDRPFQVALDIEGTVGLREIHPFVKIPMEPNGTILYTGKLLYEQDRGLEMHGDARAKDLYYRDESTRVGPLTARSHVDFLPGRLTLTAIVVGGFGGTLGGNFSWDQQEGWSFDGDLAGLNIDHVLRQMKVRGIPWSGKLAGPIEATGGKKPIEVRADLAIAATHGPLPVTGLLALHYFDRGNQLISGNSFIALPHTRLNFSGALTSGIAIEFRSTELQELKSVLRLAGREDEKLPVELRQGSFEAVGTVRGNLKHANFQGSVAATNLVASGVEFKNLKSRVSYGPELVKLEGLEFDQAAIHATGTLNAVLDEGKLEPESLLGGSLELRVSDLKSLTDQATGSAQAKLVLGGTYEEPTIEGTLSSATVQTHGVRFEQLSAKGKASRREVHISEWAARMGKSAISGVLDLKAGGNDWKLGVGTAQVKADGVALASIPQYREQQTDLDAILTTDSQLEFGWSPEGISPSKIDGKLSLANISRFGRPVGQLEFTSRTTGKKAALTATGMIGNLPLKGDATIQLGTKLETELRLQLPRLDFPTIAQLFSREMLPSPLPYEGGAEASLYFKGPLLDPTGWDGRLTIPQLQLAPNKDYVKESLPQVSEIVLKNDGPIVVEFRRGFVGTRDLKLVAKNTSITTSLSYTDATGALAGQVKGTINLAILSTLQPGMISKGVAALETSIQGTSNDPQINGKLSFSNASFYLRDVITGLDKVTGTILFDKSRATIDNLRAQTGGGDLRLDGFVGFGRTLSYRLQAQATQVRIRYPEGISTSANALLALTGTPAKSILTGNLTILRSSMGRVDAAQLMAGANITSDTSAEIQNEFLRNLQFDLKIDSAPNAEFSTSLTKDIKGEVSLRLRGTPGRPILLGELAVTQGEIYFFGSRYDIIRAEMQFRNTLRIEPIIQLDLETRLRGVTIAMNFSGPSSKLNMSYRSDPPLQPSEILALLTVGRNPTSTGSLAQTVAGQSQGGMFGNDSSLVLGAAVSAGVTGRMQRFFGISRVRIDPQLTGIDNVPQARLSLEQQVSRDVTLTYITNLNRTQQQIVRVDWDVSKAWSVVAVRDENGLFGVDLFFRKRLK